MSHRKNGNRKLILPAFDMCVYCGGPDEVFDHVPPYCSLGPGQVEWGYRSCRDCNSRLADYGGEDIGDRRLRVAGRLRSKYRKLLAGPKWSPEDYAGLEGSLLASVRESQRAVAALRERLAVLES